MTSLAGVTTKKILPSLTSYSCGAQTFFSDRYQFPTVMLFVFLSQIVRVERETLVAVSGHGVVAPVHHRLCEIDEQHLFVLHDEMVQLERRILRDAKRVDLAHTEHRAATGNI
jgi:hypothetical protein